MQLVLHSVWFKKNEFNTEQFLQNEKQEDVVKEENKKLLCKQCKNHITNVDDAISIEGAYTHTFSNPAGYIYTINCYQTAPGCLVTGKSTSEFTWFKGYEWQLAFCNSCQEQLGWFFINEQQFYALIADRITRED
jgi:yippee zinc-binding/DNA-binding/Mis18 protein involved in centromere assembly